MQNEPQREADFAGKRILVTGGTRGIGEAIVERLVRGGGKVITSHDLCSPAAPPIGSCKQTSARAEGSIRSSRR